MQYITNYRSSYALIAWDLTVIYYSMSTNMNPLMYTLECEKVEEEMEKLDEDHAE